MGGLSAQLSGGFSSSCESLDAAETPNIFQRSVQKHGQQYIEFLGEGDNKTHNLLVQEAIYGDTQGK